MKLSNCCQAPAASRAAASAPLDPALGFLEVAEDLEGGDAIAPPEPVHASDAEAEVAVHHDGSSGGGVEDGGEGGEGPDTLRGETLAAGLPEVEEDREIRTHLGRAREAMMEIDELLRGELARGDDPDVLLRCVDRVREGHECWKSPLR